ncbi:MAG: hypothetical protein H0T42_21530 [Deltaproteobacteria bacterium]|nr:hypothetical protein [Deltaproteobacteria bacterium]
MALPRAMLALCALLGCGRLEFAELRDATVSEPSCPDGGCVVAHGWSKRFGSPAVDYGSDLARSPTAREILLTGFYTTAGVDFGGGVVPTAGLHDVMVVIHDEDGGFIAARGYGGPGFDQGYGIGVATNGDIYLAGRAQDGARFGGPSLVGDAGEDIFAARFTAAGGHLWSALHGGPGADVATDLTIDESGASYLGGSFDQTVSLGGANRTAVGSSDSYVASYNAGGGHRWDRTWGGPDGDQVASVAFDPATDTVFAAGRFSGALDVGTGATPSAGMEDGFLVALDAATGSTRWSLTWGATGNDGCNGITVDKDGNVYLAAYFEGTIQLGAAQLTSAGAQDLALFSVTAQGTVRWATSHGGTAIDRGIKVAVGPSGELVTGGVFRETATIGGELVTVQGGGDMFVMATAAASGSPMWTRVFGSPGHDEMQSVVLDDRGRIFATGVFSDTISFGGPSLTSEGGLDTFLIRIDPEIVVPRR